MFIALIAFTFLSIMIALVGFLFTEILLYLLYKTKLISSKTYSLLKRLKLFSWSSALAVVWTIGFITILIIY